MAISRQLPKSDETRNLALTAAKTKKDNTAAAAIVITPATVTRLDATQPLLFNNMQTRGTRLQAQSAATALKDAAKQRAQMFISHFIQAFNNGVDRGVFPAAARAFYQLDVNSNSVPEMNTDDLVLLWGQRLVAGDAARILAGGTAMSNPTIAQVSAEVTAFRTTVTAQSAAKDAFDNAQETVSDMRESVDLLILRIWDEVETAFNDEPITSKRRKSREWGVVYTGDVQPTVFDIAGGATITVDRVAEGALFNNTGATELSITNPAGTPVLLVTAGTVLQVAAQFTPIMVVHNENPTVAGSFSVVQQG